jgi:hypothetical protein
MVGVMALALAGCAGDDDALNPRALGVSSDPAAHDAGADATEDGPDDAASDAPLDPPADAATDAAPPLRTVQLINPLGGPANNFFADGDFEWSVAPDGDGSQYAFLGFIQGGVAPVHAETGGLCRTGLHCAILKPTMALFLRGVAAPKKAKHTVSAWAKIPSGAGCAVITMLMVTCDALGNVKKLPAGEPDDSGWCEYTATFGGKDTGLCLYVESDLEGDERALVDAATLLAKDEAAKTSTKAQSFETWVPSASVLTRLAKVQDTLRRRMPFGRAPLPTAPTP